MTDALVLCRFLHFVVVLMLFGAWLFRPLLLKADAHNLDRQLARVTRGLAGGEAARADFSSPSGRFLRLFRDRGLYPFGCWRGAGAAVFLIPVQRDQRSEEHT